MKKLFFHVAMVFITMISCSKETSLPVNEQPLPEVAAMAETINGVNAVPINESVTFDYLNFFWNPCSQEWIQIEKELAKLKNK